MISPPNMSNGDQLDGEVHPFSTEALSSLNYGENRYLRSLFQGLWNRVDLNYMRPLFGGSHPGSSPTIMTHESGHHLVPNDEGAAIPFNDVPDQCSL